jgi:hypothetical protein
MKWLQLLLLTFMIFWGIRPYRDEFAAVGGVKDYFTNLTVRRPRAVILSSIYTPDDISSKSINTVLRAPDV